MYGNSDQVTSWLNFAQSPREQGGLGLAPHQAAGLVGNLVNESGSNLPSWGPTGDNGTAYGTAQWRGDRLAALKQAFPDSYQTPQAQQAFMRQEFDGPENKAYQALLAAKSPEEAASTVNHLYERSADTSGNREASARRLMAQFGGNAGTGALALADPEEADGGDGALSANSVVGPGALNGHVLSAPKDANDDKLGAIAQGLTGIGASLAGISSPQQAYALNQQLQAMKKDNKSKYAVTVTKDGKIIRYDQDGNVDVVGGTANGMPQMIGDPSKEGLDYFKTLDPVTQQLIQGWHDGTGVVPSSYQMKDPRVQQQIAAAQKAFPDMDFTRLPERKTMAQEMAKSSPASAGGQVASANASLEHLDHIADGYLTLKNGSGGGWSMAAHGQNALSNAAADPTRAGVIGKLGIDAGLASGEITKVITNGNGGVHERAERTKQLGNPNYSPEEASAALDAQASDMKAKYQQTVDRIRSTMGQSYIDKHPEIESGFNSKYEALQKKIEQLRTQNSSTAAPAKDTSTPIKPGAYVWTPQGLKAK